MSSQSDNLGAVSEKQGKRFYLDIKVLEKHYKGHKEINVVENYFTERVSKRRIGENATSGALKERERKYKSVDT